MFTDCQGIPYPVFAKGEVSESSVVSGAIPFGSVHLLKVNLEAGSQEPAAGQFYMLHAIRSDVLLGRPISIYHSEKKADGVKVSSKVDDKKYTFSFSLEVDVNKASKDALKEYGIDSLDAEKSGYDDAKKSLEESGFKCK